MAEILSFNQIVSVMKDIADRHYQINSFMSSPTWNIATTKYLTHPLLHVQPIAGQYYKSAASDSYPIKELTFEIRVIDLVNKGLNNDDDTTSDTDQIIADIITEINEHPYYQRSGLQLVGDIQTRPLVEYSDDECNGTMATITLRMKNHTAFCGLPFQAIAGFTFPGADPVDYQYSTQWLTCDTITACTTLTTYIDNQVAFQIGTGITAGNTFVQNGINTFTGGTPYAPTVNVTNLSINTFTASGASNFTGTLSSGGTDLYNIFLTANDGNDITRVQNGNQITTGGTANFPTVNLNASLFLNNITISGTNNTTGILQSGGTDLYNIFQTTADGNDITRVQGGNNIFTAGTANAPIVSLVASPIVNNLSATGTTTLNTLNAASVSASTYMSGASTLQAVIISLAGSSGDITRVEPGSNIITGGTDNLPTVNLVASPSINGLTASGTSNFTGIIQSGGTNLYSIFSQVDTNTITRVQAGSNILTGGTADVPVINLVASPSVNNFTASGTSNVTGTMQSGGTNLYSIFALAGSDTNDITRVQAGSNITTGGTGTVPIVSTVASPSFNSITASGASSFQTLSATTYISGSTNLYSIFALAGSDTNDITRVQPGANTSTGGTANLPTVNVVASPSFNSVTASGASSFTTLTATTYISGSTNLYNIFSQTDTNTITRVQAGPNITTGGTADIPVVGLASSISVNSITASGASSFQTLSATTMISGSTNLYSIFALAGSSSGSGSNIQPGTNTYTGGTAALQTVNISGGTFNNITVSGNTYLSGTTATTVTILNSGLTSTVQTDWNSNKINVGVSRSNIIGGSGQTINANRINVQMIGGVDISGTTDNTSYHSNIVATGTSMGNLYATHLYSGSTELTSIFAPINSDTNDITRVQPGANITTGGTGNLPIVNLVASPSVNAFTASGSSNFAGVSATTIYASASISGGTIYSGSTNIENTFLIKSGTRMITVSTVQPTSPTTGDLWVDTN